MVYALGNFDCIVSTTLDLPLDSWDVLFVELSMHKSFFYFSLGL